MRATGIPINMQDYMQTSNQKWFVTGSSVKSCFRADEDSRV